MRTDTVGSLRQRMIEDMNARKLGSHPLDLLSQPRQKPRKSRKDPPPA